jgi:hypothetical protein
MELKWKKDRVRTKWRKEGRKEMAITLAPLAECGASPSVLFIFLALRRGSRTCLDTKSPFLQITPL